MSDSTTTARPESGIPVWTFVDPAASFAADPATAVSAFDTQTDGRILVLCNDREVAQRILGAMSGSPLRIVQFDSLDQLRLVLGAFKRKGVQRAGINHLPHTRLDSDDGYVTPIDQAIGALGVG